MIAMSPDANAGSTWKSFDYNDFTGDGMVLYHSRLDLSGNKCRVELNNTGDWQKLTSQPQPTADEDFAMAELGNQNKIVLFGGYEIVGGSGEHPLNETWIYDIDNNSWTQMFPAVSPSPMELLTMATVRGDDRVFLFGGFLPGFNDDSWIYDYGDNLWSHLNLTDSPGGRYAHSMVPISNTNDILLFGGRGNGFLYCDTWVFNTTENSWKQLFPMNSPSARAFEAMTPIWNDDRVVLFGGEYLNDTWIFDRSDNDWHKQNPSESPCARTGEGLTKIIGENAILLFGGDDGKGNGLVDTWTYHLDLDQWEQLSTFHEPQESFSCALITSSYDNNIIYYSSTYTWMFNFSLFPPGGYYCSPYFDTGGDSSYLSICWTVACPAFTYVSFQLRTAESTIGIIQKEFVGPDGTKYSFYYDIPTIWSGNSGYRLIQYKAILTSGNSTLTPSIDLVEITYNRFPGAPELLEPANDIWSNMSNPTFKWQFNDSDSQSQGGFIFQLNGSADFRTPYFSSGIVDSDSASYQMDNPISDGAWNWRVRTRDIDGDWGPFSESWQIGVDTGPPDNLSINVSPPGWTSDPVAVSFDATDNVSGLAGYDIWIDAVDYGDQDSPYIIPHLRDGIHTISVWATDKAGNRAEAKSKLFIDNNPPAHFTPITSPDSWVNDLVEIMFSTTDNGSGIDHYEANIDNGRFSVQTSPWIITAPADGRHTITIRAFDRIGNFQDGTIIIFVDKSPPVNLFLSLNPAGWTNLNPQLTFFASDLLSGIDHYEIEINDGGFVTRTSPLTFEGLSDGLNLITVRADDKAGNYAEGDITAKIDKTPPNPFSLNITPSGWTRNQPTIMFSASDNLSGMEYYALSVDGDDFVPTISPYLVHSPPDGIHDVIVRAFDKAGNFRDGNGRIYIDTTPPSNVSLKLSNGKGTVPTLNIALSIIASDNASGLASMRFSNDGVAYSAWEPFCSTKNWSLSLGTGKKKIFVEAMDNSGNAANPAWVSVDYQPNAQNTLMTPALLITCILLIALAAVLVFIKFGKHR